MHVMKVLGTCAVGLAAIAGLFQISSREPYISVAVAAEEHPFDPIGEVMEHPRCMNCHPRDSRPRQGNAGFTRMHQMNVQRGEDGKGLTGQKCSACHQEANNTFTNAPGAPNWHLAPLSMGWQGLTRPELCKALLDKSKNGNRTPADLIKHMGTEPDPLVMWGWNPGKSRDPIPVPHDEFVVALKRWVELNTPCPEN
jgi:hypothetical protein